MGWRTVVINTHSKLTYANNHLVFKNAQQTEKIHLSEIDILILETTDITITTMLLKRLTDEKILMTSDCRHRNYSPIMGDTIVVCSYPNKFSGNRT